jgi:23S rRNA (uracil1939-C5)-methyltransferase
VANRRKKILENISLEKVAAEGKSLAYLDDKVVFVEKTVPGDVVDVRVQRKRKNFLEGTPIKFHEYSPLRIPSFCEYFGTCGGCKWQFLSYENQLEFKQQQVVDQLERIGGLKLPSISPIIGSPKTTNYRNKLEFTFTNQRWLMAEEIANSQELERRGLGFHMPGRFDKVLDIHDCWLQPPPSNEIRNFVREYALSKDLGFFDLRAHEGFLRNLIVRTANTGETMVILQSGSDLPELYDLLRAIDEKFPDIASLNYVINTKKNETFWDLEVINYSGKDHIIEEMSDYHDNSRKLRFKVGPKSFYQTNSDQAENLYRVTADFAKLSGEETVYDLYTGTGTIANYIASSAKHLIGVESVEMAIEDARENASMNNNGNIDFVAGDMKDVLNDEFIAQHGAPDVVITDPPRAGMHPDVVDMLNRLKPPRIVYVSCNPATQARDLSMLDKCYVIEKVQPVDMFPHTHHVENVCLLVLNN